ncbi:MAG: DNA modification methylase, partial [Anaerolineae bacterium]|nr:DNA modification methylase [Anaerolineae bacterium]
ADRTRLEMYFFGLASSWSDITHQVRDKLVVSATTQVTRTGNVSTQILGDVRRASPRLYRELVSKCTELQAKRCERGGCKNYDLMVAMYFRDMVAVLNSILTVLKPGAQLMMILGDSAPYGVHIPTDRFLARLGHALGFASYRVYPLRERGRKWTNNRRRHQVGLRESLVVLTKPS